MELTFSPKTAVALWALGRLYSEQLPVIAYEWLEAGWDSPTLRMLAGERNPIMSEVGPMFDKALEELGFVVPAPSDVPMQLVSEIAQKIVEGTVSPYDGAREIGDLRLEYSEENGVHFSDDIWFLAVEYEDYAEYPNLSFFEKQRRQKIRAELEVAMMEEARKLIV